MNNSMAPFEALAILESLKLGVVPDEALDLLSVGLDQPMSNVDLDLEETRSAPGGSFRLLTGDYGQGKSHLMAMIERRALEKGFLVARASLGGQVSSDQRIVYDVLAASIRYPDNRERGLERLLREAASRDGLHERWTSGPSPFELDGSAGHLLLATVGQGPHIAIKVKKARSRPAIQVAGSQKHISTPVGSSPHSGGTELTAFGQTAPDTRHAWLSVGIQARWCLMKSDDREGAETLAAWMEGQPVDLSTLRWMVYDSVANGSGSGSLDIGCGTRFVSIPRTKGATQTACYMLGGIGCLARDLGYGGLVILLDEAESIGWISPRQQDHATRLIHGLRVASTPGLSTFGLMAGGGSRQRRIPFRHRPVQHLACFVALTQIPPDDGSSHFNVAFSRDRLSRVHELTVPELEELARRILCLASASELNGMDLEMCQKALSRAIHRHNGAGRLLMPRRVTQLAAYLPDLARCQGLPPEGDLQGWMGLNGQHNMP